MQHHTIFVNYKTYNKLEFRVKSASTRKGIVSPFFGNYSGFCITFQKYSGFSFFNFSGVFTRHLQRSFLIRWDRMAFVRKLIWLPRFELVFEPNPDFEGSLHKPEN